MSDGEWLVAFDTDRIKDYLFATNKLKEIRGASALLVKLNETDTESVVRRVCPATDTVYAAGGGALFIVPSEADANRVIAAVEKLYRQETAVASITGACLALAPATRQEGFGKRIRDLGFLLHRSKARKAQQPVLAIAPYLHPCDACGRHPAAHRQRDEEGQDQLLCRACHIKREHTPILQRNEPQDFGELGGLSHPPGYLGFIHADGNLMGNRLAQLGTKENYTDFATGVICLLDNAARAATSAFSLRDGKKPYIGLLLGGDDLLLTTAADLALPAALELAQFFEKNSSDLLKRVRLDGQSLTLSASVVLAHADYPIAEMHRLSIKCLQRAKRRSFEAGYATGAVDFQVVTSAVGYEDDRRPYRDRRPYTLNELAELLDYAAALQDFPTSQLQAMYESLYLSREAATLTSLLALARVRPRRRQLALRGFFQWSGSLTPNQLPPWCEPGVTALGDLVEVLPFVSERR